jgi:hypothetical protein
MNYKQNTRVILLATLIAAPMIVLLAMQMPSWFPPKEIELKHVVYANDCSLLVIGIGLPGPRSAATACRR